MTRYIHTQEDQAIRSVDVTMTPSGATAYIHLRDESAVPAVTQRLASIGRTVLTQATVDGRPMLITEGPRSEADLIAHLSAEGALTLHVEKKPFDAWKVRSALGIGGQTLQLASSLMKGKHDWPLFTFAVSNLAANGINWIYRAQQHDDPHQLRLLKKTVNERLGPQLRPGYVPLGTEERRAPLREQNKPKPVDPFHNFMQKHSVNIGELGLRFIGAFGMAFPANDWGKAIGEMRIPHTDEKAPLRTIAGFGSIAGKTIALGSKIPDPYNPKPPGPFDKLREKYAFVTGGLVEAGAFTTLAYDAFMNTAPKDLGNGQWDTSRSLKFGGSYHRDWLSGVGAAMFVAGYIVRSWAKFGERRVNMPELYAHVSDTLAMLPPEQIPQQLADTAAFLADHFKGQPGLSFQVIYEKLSNDLYRSHHIAAQPTVQTAPALVPVEQQPGFHIQAGDAEHTAPAAAQARTA